MPPETLQSLMPVHLVDTRESRANSVILFNNLHRWCCKRDCTPTYKRLEPCKVGRGVYIKTKFWSRKY
ncbi:MAG: hypothetical protein EBV42_07450, partial [Actinobacteria bacterium]|nr:hypothetical protein [Actinomycetota bacterium]